LRLLNSSPIYARIIFYLIAARGYKRTGGGLLREGVLLSRGGAAPGPVKTKTEPVDPDGF